jgi:hypothetical protein
LVEQWIENPCVPGSIPGETTNCLHGGSFLFQTAKKQLSGIEKSIIFATTLKVTYLPYKVS